MSMYVSHVSLPLFVTSLRSCGCSLDFLSLYAVRQIIPAVVVDCVYVTV